MYTGVNILLPVELARSIRRVQRRETARQKIIACLPIIFGVSAEFFERLFSQMDRGDRERLINDAALLVHLHLKKDQPPDAAFLRNIVGETDLMADWARRFALAL